MAEKTKTDTLMKFELASGKGGPLYAECLLEPAEGDTLMTGFNARLGNYFEIHDFDFSMSLKESDDTKITSDAGPFARWRSATAKEYKPIVGFYPFEFDKFSFKRVLDKASPIFFKKCCDSVTFDSATIVKRMSQDIDRPPVGFLRLDFTRVLITGVDWSDGEMISESIDFIAQKLKVTLRTQSADGTILASNEKVITWDPENDVKTGKVISG